ncbi:MAG: nitroreductase family protein [bacterium]|nr:nitroreductase family protein [bacterium]
MKQKTFAAVACAVLALGTAVPSRSQAVIPLPAPRVEGGRPLMQVLKDRRSTRAFKPDTLPLPVLSDLLWAAFGVNRPERGLRTAPSAVNWQEIDVYAALPSGLFRYNAETHTLDRVLAGDIRAATGLQPFVGTAPLNLVLVADYARMARGSAENKDQWAWADAAFISENVYLYCASEGLGTVVRAMVDRPALSEKMGLRPDQKIILAQTVGFPDDPPPANR